MKKITFRHLIFLTFSLSPFLAFSQNVGIGTTVPEGKLQIAGDSNVSQLIIDANSTQGNISPLIKLRKSDGTVLLGIHSDHITNIFMGLNAGGMNVAGTNTGVNNTFVGRGAGSVNTTGTSNTAYGSNALYFNTTASQNTAIGLSALRTQSYDPGSSWASANVAVGYEALFSNQPTLTTNGVNNTAIGHSALRSNSTGWDNTGVGATSLYYNTTGKENTAIGKQALFNNTTGYSNVAAGYKALNGNTKGCQNIAIGNFALYTQSTDPGFNWNSDNVAVGFRALYSNQPTNNVDASQNTAIGNYALEANTNGWSNTANGHSALRQSSTGKWNTAIGANALNLSISGNENTALGSTSLYSNNGGSANTAAGSDALFQNNVGSNNTAIGNNSLYNNIGGSANTALGYNAGSAVGSPNVNNTISIGNDGYLNGASNQAFLGNLSTLWNGGNVSWSTYSDARVKNNVREDVAGLNFITRLRPVTYYRSIKAMREITGNRETEDYPGKYDIEKIKFTGFLAQEVEQAALQSNYDFSGITIPKNSQELYTLSYEQFVVPLVKAVQELNEKLVTEVASLKSEAQTMQNERENLVSEFTTLSQRIEKLEALLKEK